jgi:hypothetical protein
VVNGVFDPHLKSPHLRLKKSQQKKYFIKEFLEVGQKTEFGTIFITFDFYFKRE